MFLTANDFYVSKSGELCINHPGYNLVFFFSNDCIYCKDVKPAFDRLSQQIQGCSFKFMDVYQNNQQIRSMAAETSHPIDYVPQIILYRNGNRVAQFLPDEANPANNLTKLTNFLFSHTGTKNPQTTTALPATTVPAYSIGIPGNYAQKNVCYFSYDKAYGALKK